MVDIFESINFTKLGEDLGGFFNALLPVIVGVLIALAVVKLINKWMGGIFGSLKV